MTKTPGLKVIYLVIYPLDVRDAKRFGLTELQDAGLQVEVWDLSHFVHPAASGLGIESPNWVNITVCSSVEHFSNLCSTLTAEHTVILFGLLRREQLWQARKLLRLISATPARLGSISSGQTPPPILPGRCAPLVSGRIGRVFRLLSHPRKWKKTPLHLASVMLLQLIAVQRRMHLRSSIRPLDHIWASTMVSGIGSIFANESTKVTYIHTLDYDQVLAIRKSGRQPLSRVVFIDSMGPLHPDYLLLFGESVISAQTYSEIICRGLDEIERRLGTQVVVAAHPRSAPGVMEAWYGGRTLFFGKTAELVAYATAIFVAECSTAIGLATVFQRPLVILSSAKFDSFIQDGNRAFSRELSTPIIDLDAPDLPPFNLNVNEEAYAQYVEKYIKRPGTPEEPFWSVVASEIVSGAQPPDVQMLD
ncbi:MAG: hypothetical protein OSA11_02265 [Candidatus Nanopelagicales bacterium]|nr:hypothetical protein [Candidatus Nanopelagicales bacterium]